VRRAPNIGVVPGGNALTHFVLHRDQYFALPNWKEGPTGIVPFEERPVFPNPYDSEDFCVVQYLGHSQV
jgi:hypothetical protein